MSIYYCPVLQPVITDCFKRYPSYLMSALMTKSSLVLSRQNLIKSSKLYMTKNNFQTVVNYLRGFSEKKRICTKTDQVNKEQNQQIKKRQ